MSISDRIVVMKEGVLQQIGAPQQVYDDPANLFVAKFLGTPPINVFDGQIQNGMLCLGGEAVLPVPGLNDQSVTVGIRPEGFLPQADGPLSCTLNSVEVMGRDISVVASHPACQSPTLRAIITADAPVDRNASTVRFALKPEKVFSSSLTPANGFGVRDETTTKSLALPCSPPCCFWGRSWSTPSSTCSSTPVEEGYNFASQTYFGVGLYNYSYVLHEPLLPAGGEKHLPAGHHHRPPVYRTGPGHLPGPQLHSAPPGPVPDHLLSALCDQHPGCGSGVYDPLPEDGVHRWPHQPDDPVVLGAPA